MASFKAENIESDGEVEEEIDDTREIQIEDALKLYQNALKLHAQGPRHLKEASEAYDELFKSEIFKYPEAVGEFAREEKLGVHVGLAIEAPRDVAKAAEELEAVAAALPPVAGVGEDASSTLPNLLYLSYKNRSLFKLEVIRDTLRRKQGALSKEDRKESIQQVTSVLLDLGEALDKDEGDADTWRHAARVCESMGSTRLARFCLEAALEDDGEGTDQLVGLRSFEAELIGNDLRRLEEKLDDDLAVEPLQDAFGGDNALPVDAIEAMALHEFLPNFNALNVKPDTEAPRHIINLPECSWTAIGEALSELLRNPSRLAPGTVIGFEAPQIMNIEVEEINADRTVKPPVAPEVEVKPSPQAMDDVRMEDDSNESSHEKPINRDSGPDSLDKENSNQDAEKLKPIELPSRKRSSAEAELPESTEGVRARSKRIRERGSLLPDAHTVEVQETDNTQEKKLEELRNADVWLFDVLDGILQKLDVPTFAHGPKLRTIVSEEKATVSVEELEGLSQPMRTALRTFYKALQSWSDDKTKLLIKSKPDDATAPSISGGGLSAFLETPKGRTQPVPPSNPLEGAAELVETINNGYLTLEAASLVWLFGLIYSNEDGHNTRYLDSVWSESLKHNATQILSAVDTPLLELITSLVDSHRDLRDDDAEATTSDDLKLESICNVTQTIFELHLDEYSRISDRASIVNDSSKTTQLQRVDRWVRLAREALRFRGIGLDDDEDVHDLLALRHVWATVLYMETSSQIPRTHIVACFEDLKARLSRNDEKLVIQLANSTAMAELSAQAADREISRLETMDFFLTVFTKEDDSPVDLIERLEPILMPATEIKPEQEADDVTDGIGATVDQRNGSNLSILTKFLAKTSAALRLSLWRKLLEAYRAIDYKPKMFSIQLKMLEIIMHELQSTSEDQSAEDHESTILLWLNRLSKLLLSTYELARDVDNIMECIDLDHLKSSVRVLADLYLLLYPVSLYDDHNMLTSKAAAPTNPFRKYPREALHNAMKLLHDLQMKTAVLMDQMFVEAVVQLPEAFKGPHFDSGLAYRLQYLRHVHYAYGARRLCKTSDSLFLKYQRSVVQGLASSDQQASDDLSQILLDLFDLNCFSSQLDRQDHGCDTDYLNHRDALELLDFVLGKARKANVKDLLKSEMGKAVEKFNTALGLIKSSQATQRNRKICHQFLHSPINPLLAYRALRGVGELPTAYIRPSEAVVAAKGWYFLQGQLAMAKYRAARLRNTPGDEDDLKSALDYFSQDLEFSSERWETWYCLAQTNDALIEEEVLWTAEKLNNNRGDLIQGQRASIHAYEMALATALRTASSSSEILDRMADLCSDFGLRVYSSSREPFSMQPFSLSDFSAKNFSSAEIGGGLYQRRRFHSMRPFDAWKLAEELFDQAIKQRPKRWLNHYLKGKCLWKMSRHPKNPFRHRKYKTPADCTVAAIKAFERAVQLLPKRKDPSRGEPTLEPIYKMVAVLLKLVASKEIPELLASERIAEMLQAQNQFEVLKAPRLEDFDSWVEYILGVLKVLRSADKTHWHHRITFRTATIMYNKQGENVEEQAKLVKDFLQDQKLYSTKTLAISVWKPDNERAGRHWIYMTRYAKFLAEIIEKTDDLEAIQLLAKRVRKRSGDYYDHVNAWLEISQRHTNMHRKAGNIQRGLDETVFRNMQQDEFVAKAVRIDEWAQDPATDHPLRNILAEVAELKKLNSGLIKSNHFDDLLAETYATIWEQVLPTFDPPVVWPPPDRQNGQRATADTSRAVTPTPEVSPRRNVMSLTNLMNMDSAGDSKPAVAPGTLQFIQQNPPSRPSSTAPTDPGVPVRRSRIISRREYLKRANEATWPKTKEGAGPGRGRRASVDREASSSGVIRFNLDDTPASSSKVAVALGSTARTERNGSSSRRRSSSKLQKQLDATNGEGANGVKAETAIIDDSDSSLSELLSEPDEPSQVNGDHDESMDRDDHGADDDAQADANAYDAEHGEAEAEDDEDADEDEDADGAELGTDAPNGEDGEEADEASEDGDGDDEGGYNSNDGEEKWATPEEGEGTPADQVGNVSQHGPVASWGLTATPSGGLEESRGPGRSTVEGDGEGKRRESASIDVEMDDV